MVVARLEVSVWANCPTDMFAIISWYNLLCSELIERELDGFKKQCSVIKSIRPCMDEQFLGKPTEGVCATDARQGISQASGTQRM